MDREDAIKILKMIDTVPTMGEQDDAIEMAISALEQQPCEDAISRQAVLDTLKEMMQPCGDGLSIYDQGNFIHNETLADVHQTIEELPSVSTEKTGRWIGDKSYPICPKCNCNIIEEYISCSDYSEMYKPMKYCPNCGCWMGVEE